jgi:ring-1,2-phenylacetyl-CoA epoxidase subunit PaaC
MNEIDQILIKKGIAIDLEQVKKEWNATVNKAFVEYGLEIPQNVFMQTGSRNGVHTEHLGFLLAEMQSLHRTIPGVKW